MGPKGKASKGYVVSLAGTFLCFAIQEILEKQNCLFIISPKYFLHLAGQGISQMTFQCLGPLTQKEYRTTKWKKWSYLGNFLLSFKRKISLKKQKKSEMNVCLINRDSPSGAHWDLPTVGSFHLFLSISFIYRSIIYLYQYYILSLLFML